MHSEHPFIGLALSLIKENYCLEKDEYHFLGTGKVDPYSYIFIFCHIWN